MTNLYLAADFRILPGEREESEYLCAICGHCYPANKDLFVSVKPATEAKVKMIWSVTEGQLGLLYDIEECDCLDFCIINPMWS